MLYFYPSTVEYYLKMSSHVIISCSIRYIARQKVGTRKALFDNLETLPASKSYFCFKYEHFQGSVMHLLWYTRNWSTQPQVYINCNAWVPPLVWLHFVYLILHDITACDEFSHAFSHCICRCTVAVFEACIQVQAGRFYHMRDINVFLGRGNGCGESLYLPDGENLPGHPQSDQKMMEN